MYVGSANRCEEFSPYPGALHGSDTPAAGDNSAKVFGGGPVRLTAGTTAADVDGWDSLSHVRLLLEVEKCFKIKISMRDAMKLANVGELAKLVEAKLKTAAA